MCDNSTFLTLKDIGHIIYIRVTGYSNRNVITKRQVKNLKFSFTENEICLVNKEKSNKTLNALNLPRK